MEEKKDTTSVFMLNKVYLEDYTNMIETCSRKCFNNYDSDKTSSNEQICLERCYLKSLDLNKYVADEYYNEITPHQH